jgi:hypothetical protein
VGRVYGFELGQTDPGFILEGEQEMEQYGFNVHTDAVDGQDHLFVSAATQGYVVSNYDIPKIQLHSKHNAYSILKNTLRYVEIEIITINM